MLTLLPGVRSGAIAPSWRQRAGSICSDDFLPLKVVCDRAAVRRVLEDQGVASTDPVDLIPSLFQKLVASYESVLRNHRSSSDLLTALIRRHEIENLVLAWRAMCGGVPEVLWTRWWLPLGELATLELKRFRSARTEHAFPAAVDGTPWTAPVRASVSARSGAPLERALNRWVWNEILAEVGRIDPEQKMVVRVVRQLVRERDITCLAAASSEDAIEDAIDAMVLLPLEYSRSSIHSLALTPREDLERHPLVESLVCRRRRIRRMEHLAATIHRELLNECRRQVPGSSFELAPAFARLLLREEELGGLIAIVRDRARLSTGGKVTR